MKAFILILIGLLLAACGPVYETEYRYIPPAAESAQTCIAECRAQQERCFQSADARADIDRQFCEMDERLNYTRCLSQQYDQQRRVSCYQPLPCYTAPNYSACTLGFNTCFQTCGGKVERERVCTYRCPAEPAAPAALP